MNLILSWPAQLDVLPLIMPTLQIKMECRRFGWHTRVMGWLLDFMADANGPIMVETLTLVVVPPLFLDTITMDDDDWEIQWSRLDELLTAPNMKRLQRLKVTFKSHVHSHTSWEGSNFIEWVHEKLPLVDERNMLDTDTVEDTS